MRERSFYGDIALIIGVVLMTIVICNCAKSAPCPGGVCPLPQIPKVVKGEASVVASRAVQTIRCPRELTSNPKCHNQRFRGVVRRVLGRFGR